MYCCRTNLIAYATTYGPMGPRNALWKIDLPARTIQLIRDGGDFMEDAGLAISPQGQLYSLFEPGDLIAIDKNTGASAVVGNIGFGSNGFGADYSGNTFVGAAKKFGGDGVEFFTVDTTTGARSDFLFLSELNSIGSITFSDATTVYLSATSSSGGANALYTLDIPTKTLSRIGDLSVGFDGLDFGPDGTLYGVAGHKVYEVNPYTAAETMLFDAGSDTENTSFSGFAIDASYSVKRCSFFCRLFRCC